MTEIFYRLLSQANGNLYLIEKEERFNFIQSISKNILTNENRDEIELGILKATMDILEEYQNMDLLHPTLSPSIPERRALAVKCLNVKKDIYDLVAKRVEGIQYKSISNEEFSQLKKSELTQFFYVALFVSECRGRLMEYLLVHRP